MTSDRKNLRIDEQSFQRVLCAAFTIQEYNGRKLAGTPIAHGAERAELLNCVQRDLDLDRQGVGSAAEEGVDTEVLLALLEEQFEPPALAIDRSYSGGGEAALMGNKDQVAALEFILGRDVPQEHIAAIAASQLAQTEDDLIARRGAGVGEGTPIVGVTPHADDSVDVVSNHLLPEIIQKALQATHATGAAIALRRQGKLVCQAAAGDSASEIGALINAGSAFTGLCAGGTMQSCSNTALDSRLDADACRKLGVRAITVVPLLRQDQLLGLIAVFSRLPYAFGMRDLRALQDLAEKFTAKLQVGAALAPSASTS
jgi:GAF domain-containing protein